VTRAINDVMKSLILVTWRTRWTFRIPWGPQSDFLPQTGRIEAWRVWGKRRQ